MIEVLAPAGMWDVALVQMFECSEVATLREVIRMVVGSENRVDPHPFQLCEVLGVRACVRAASPLPGMFEIMKEKFEIGDAEISAAQQLDQPEEVWFTVGL